MFMLFICTLTVTDPKAGITEKKFLKIDEISRTNFCENF